MQLVFYYDYICYSKAENGTTLTLHPLMELPAILRGTHTVGGGGQPPARQAGSDQRAPTMEESAESGGQPLGSFLSVDIRQPQAHQHQRPIHGLLIRP